MIDFCRHNWYHLGAILFAALAFFLLLGPDVLSETQVILMCSFMAMLVHQCEEYSWPGGFPSMANVALFRDKGIADRYPFNANQCWISNVFLTYAFYLIAVFFPDVIWLGLAQVMLGMLQIIAHGVVANVKLKSFYNPGLGATVLLQWPIGIIYITRVASLGLAGPSTYVLGILGAFAAAMVLFGFPILIMRNRDTTYPFHPDEVYGFAEDKIRKMQVKVPEDTSSPSLDH